jgi:multisubunit Na+/H+ antiporter MnhG subunit
MGLKPLLALTCLILSQGTILVSYLIALQFDHPKIESCNPFFQGCLNITDAGIYSPEGYVFRGGMIMACAFFIMWWAVSFKQLKSISTSWLNPASTILGVIGAILLIVATAVLIPPRDAINWDVHVAGAILFFLVTFVAQALHLALCSRKEIKLTLKSISLKIKWVTVGVQGIMIAVALTFKALDSGDDIVNAIEWWLALLIAVYFYSAYYDWQAPAKN